MRLGRRWRHKRRIRSLRVAAEVSKRSKSFGAMECLVFLDALSRLHEGMPEAGMGRALRPGLGPCHSSRRSYEPLAKNAMRRSSWEARYECGLNAQQPQI